MARLLEREVAWLPQLDIVRLQAGELASALEPSKWVPLPLMRGVLGMIRLMSGVLGMIRRAPGLKAKAQSG